MDRRLPVAIIGLVEVLAPRQIANFWVARCCRNPEEVALRPWVVHAIRLEGLMLLAWVVWRSRNVLGDFEPITKEAEEETRQPVPDEPTFEPRLDPDTRRFDIAAVLYHADEPLSVAEVVELSSGMPWEIGRSTASATLYRMYNEELVDRSERDDEGRFEYWLTEQGTRAVEAADATIEPNPFLE